MQWRIRLTFHSFPAERDFSFLFDGVLSDPRFLASLVLWIKGGRGERRCNYLFQRNLGDFCRVVRCWLFESYWKNGVDDGRFEEVETLVSLQCFVTICGLAFSKDFLLVSIVHFVLTILLILGTKGVNYFRFESGDVS